jgi:glucose-6-phosphate isomerase
MLHQGTQIVPVDFIAVLSPLSELPCAKEHHRQLIANCLAQSQALAKGYKHPTDPNLSYSGNRPNNIIWLPKLDAYHLGALMALYEHRTFCLGILYGVNSFDQPGVELGKRLAKPIDQALANPQDTGLLENFDEVTKSRIQWLQNS